jgi:hypothetical protein
LSSLCFCKRSAKDVRMGPVAIQGGTVSIGEGRSRTPRLICGCATGRRPGRLLVTGRWSNVIHLYIWCDLHTEWPALRIMSCSNLLDYGHLQSLFRCQCNIAPEVAHDQATRSYGT